jgi:hypothetical protein
MHLAISNSLSCYIYTIQSPTGTIFQWFYITWEICACRQVKSAPKLKIDRRHTWQKVYALRLHNLFGFFTVMPSGVNRSKAHWWYGSFAKVTRLTCVSYVTPSRKGSLWSPPSSIMDSLPYRPNRDHHRVICRRPVTVSPVDFWSFSLATITVTFIHHQQPKAGPHSQAASTQNKQYRGFPFRLYFPAQTLKIVLYFALIALLQTISISTWIYDPGKSISHKTRSRNMQ